MALCPACAERNPGRARFCLGCGLPLPEQASQPEELRRTVSVIFADLAGSTVLGETLDAETLRHVTGRFFDTMREAVETHQGTVEKFIGDAVVAVFGVPRVREDDALRAVRAAADMRSALTGLNAELHRDLGVRLEVRIGLNTGEVVYGDERAGGSFATGDAVNLAARLEQSAAAGEVLVGDSTYRLVRDWVNVEPVEALSVKGKAEPVTAWRLTRVATTTETPAGRSGGSQFVGRDSQLRLLEDGFRRVVAENGCQLVTVLGVAGVGKTRLVDEFATRRTDALVLHGRCLSYGQGATYWPLRQAVLAATGLSGEESALTAEARLGDVLGDTDAVAQAVTRLLSVAGYHRDEVVPEDVPWAVRAFLEALARSRPVVLVVDDLHWAEPGLLDVVEHVADWSRDAPIMLIGLARPEFYDDRPSWGGGKFNATAMLLSPLDDAGTASLIDKHDLPAQVRAHIVDSAGGNPLFAEQLVATLLDEGRATVRDGVVTWTGGPQGDAALDMPPTVAALLAARIDRLPDDERAMLGCAAVIGPVFYVEALAALTGRPAGEVRDGLDRLVRKELLRPAASDLAGATAYRFLHALVRDAAYDGLAKATRAQFHEDAADWLAALDDAAIPDEIVGHHWASACDYRRQLGPVSEHTRDLAARAGGRLIAAARRLELSDVSAAAALAQRAVDLFEPGDPQRAEALITLGPQRLELGEIDAARTALGEAAEAATEREVLLARVMMCRANTFTAEDRVESMERVVTDAIQRFEAWGDDPALGHAYLARAELAMMRLELGLGEELLARAVHHAGLAGDPACAARARSALTVCYLFGSTPAEAVIELMERALAESGNDPRSRAEVEEVTCVMHAMCGRFDIARATAAAAREHLAQVGHGLYLANFAQSAGRVEELAGDLDAAEREYEISTAALDRLGESSYLSTVAGLHARLLCLRGKAEQARSALDLARAHGSPDDVTTQSLIHQVEALLAVAAGDFERATSSAEQAVRLEGANPGYPDPAGEVRLVAARVARARGDAIGEREHLTAARSLFEAKGNVVRAGQVASRLRDLPD